MSTEKGKNTIPTIVAQQFNVNTINFFQTPEPREMFQFFRQLFFVCLFESNKMLTIYLKAFMYTHTHTKWMLNSIK